MIRQEYYSVFAPGRIHALHALAPKLVPRNYFYVLASGCVNTATVSMQGERAKVRIHIGEGANTYFKKNFSKIVSCICASANTGPTCNRAKINSSRIFPACIGFVPGVFRFSSYTLFRYA